jgi:Tol biopolymer transport system component
VVKNLNGNDASSVPVFGGFAAPQPGNPTRIAFAGQPALSSWGAASSPGPTGTAPSYNQDNNYVFLNSAAGGQYTSAPLEPAASISVFDQAYQGRAPYWSPNGQYIVFESSRAGGYALFLANVAKVAQGGKPVQLTDSSYWAQHAKFLPGGTRLVFTALQTPSATNTGPRGIAIIDISAFLN